MNLSAPPLDVGFASSTTRSAVSHMYSIYLEGLHHFQTIRDAEGHGGNWQDKSDESASQSKAISAGRWFWTVRSDFKGHLLLELLVCNVGDGGTGKVD